MPASIPVGALKLFYDHHMVGAEHAADAQDASRLKLPPKFKCICCSMYLPKGSAPTAVSSSPTLTLQQACEVWPPGASVPAPLEVPDEQVYPAHVCIQRSRWQPHAIVEDLL
jgi:hypothetical protein